MIHLGRPDDALELIHLAQYGSRDCASPRTQSMLYAMEARAYANMGQPGRCKRAVRMAEDIFAEADEWDEPDPDWILASLQAELYGENSHSFRDLAYVAGRSPAYASLADPLMRRAVELFAKDEEHQRSYALNLIGMATVHLLRREPEESTVLAVEAMRIAKKVRSERVNTRIRKTVDTAGTALGVILVIGKRVGFKKDPMRPHSLPLVMLGAGLLWFGWFGFNAGSWLGNDDGVGALMFVNTQVATGAAVLGWLAYEKIRHGAFTTLGAASGAVSGLVAITPAGGAVSPLGAIAVGLIAGVVCAMAVGLKYRFGYDDSLDVVGVHLVGGILGSLLIGFFASGKGQSDVEGLFYGGGLDQFWKQCAGVFGVLAYSLVVSAVLAFLLDKTIGMRVSEDVEVAGIDQAEHAETAYDFSGAGGGAARTTATPAASTAASAPSKKVDA
ncbi:hypothetical protein SVIOM342S_07949 [Streptomyces violaceorubidus]